MRAREFLIEYKYDHNLTFKKYKYKLWDRFISDLSYTQELRKNLLLMWEYFVEKKPDAKEFPSHELENMDYYITQHIERAERADPSEDKHFVRWMLNMYIAGFIERFEDIDSTVSEMLTQYMYLQLHKKLPKELSNLNNIKSKNQLSDLLWNMNHIYYGVILNKNERTKGKVKLDKQLSDVRVIVPANEDAACYYGQGTTWCTAATESDNYFDQYNDDGDLYILIPNDPQYPGEKYQLHKPSDQYMNERDQEVNIYEIVTRFNPDFKKWLFSNEEFDDLEDALLFADDATIEYVIRDVANEIRSVIHEELTEWEVNDNYYHDMLYDKTIHTDYLVNDKLPWIDEDGHIDREEIPEELEWINWNDDAMEWFQDVRNYTEDLTALEIKEHLLSLDYDDGWLSIISVPDVMGEILRHHVENVNSIADYLENRVIVNTNTHQVSSY